MFRAGSRDVDLLRAAAELQEISQSDFVRQVVRRAAKRVLAGSPGEEQKAKDPTSS